MTKMIITTPEELQQLIQEAVQAAFREHGQGATSQADTIKYMTIAEAATYLNLAKQTVYGFTSTRAIPFIKRAKRLLFVKSDLDAWLAEGKKRSVGQLQATIALTGKAA